LSERVVRAFAVTGAPRRRISSFLAFPPIRPPLLWGGCERAACRAIDGAVWTGQEREGCVVLARGWVWVWRKGSLSLSVEAALLVLLRATRFFVRRPRQVRSGELSAGSDEQVLAREYPWSVDGPPRVTKFTRFSASCPPPPRAMFIVAGPKELQEEARRQARDMGRYANDSSRSRSRSR